METEYLFTTHTEGVAETLHTEEFAGQVDDLCLFDNVYLDEWNEPVLPYHGNDFDVTRDAISYTTMHEMTGVCEKTEFDSYTIPGMCETTSVIPSLAHRSQQHPAALSFADNLISDEVRSNLIPPTSSFETKQFTSPANLLKPKEKEDNRGKHWREKVENGNLPLASKGNQLWAEKRKELEEKFIAEKRELDPCYCIPWTAKDSTSNARYKSSGNTAKVLYMEITRMASKGVVIITEDGESDDSFFGIKEFVVPRSQQQAFDSGLFPSVASTKVSGTKNDAKKFKKIWETAGFIEQSNPVGLQFSYSKAVFQKQRRQQPSQSSRAKKIHDGIFAD